MVDLERDLGDHQGSVFEQQVVGLENAAGLRILDRDEGEVNRLVSDPMEDVTKGPEGLWCGRGKRGMQRLFGVGAWFPLVADRDLARDLATLKNVALVERLQLRQGIAERYARVPDDPDRLAVFLVVDAVGVADGSRLLDFAAQD